MRQTDNPRGSTMTRRAASRPALHSHHGRSPIDMTPIALLVFYGLGVGVMLILYLVVLVATM